MPITDEPGVPPQAPVFTPLPHHNRVDAIAQRLGDAITLGALPDGAPLPPEPEMADRFGVATTTVREALNQLRENELVVTRRGRNGGSFVRSPTDGPRSALMRRLRLLGQGELRDLGDHYTAIAGACASLAAERADEGEILVLRDAGDLVLQPDQAGVRVRAEATFHTQVAVAAQSARLTRAELDLQAEIGFMLWLGHDDHTAVEARHAHRALVEAIAERDAGRARTEAEAHLQALRSVLHDLHRRARRGET